VGGPGIDGGAGLPERTAGRGEQADAQGFTFEFLQSTLENWQSKFLQLFSFVVLSALLIHRGSGE
jgi:hypothetical protein